MNEPKKPGTLKALLFFVVLIILAGVLVTLNKSATAPTSDTVDVATQPVAVLEHVPFSLLPHQSAHMEGDTTLTFESITDSRCATDVQCIQAGSADLVMTYYSAGKTKTINIGTAKPSYTDDSIHLELQSVIPEPKSTIRIDPSKYSAMFAYWKPVVDLTPSNGSNTSPQDSSGQATDINDLIQVTLPTPDTEITSPLSVVGKARGTWYFEASFPIELKNEKGESLIKTPAHAQGDWMTEDFVPFQVDLKFAKQPSGSKGTLILRNDNPSGDPSKDKSIEIPVVFK